MTRDSSSYPPPPDTNPLTATWYELQRERRERKRLEGDFEDFQRSVFDQFKKLERQRRASSHDLEERLEEVESTQVRDLRAQLKSAQDRKAVWEKRVWTLVSAVILLIASAIVREITRSPHRETPVQTQK